MLQYFEYRPDRDVSTFIFHTRHISDCCELIHKSRTFIIVIVTSSENHYNLSPEATNNEGT